MQIVVGNRFVIYVNEIQPEDSDIQHKKLILNAKVSNEIFGIGFSINFFYTFVCAKLTYKEIVISSITVKYIDTTYILSPGKTKAYPSQHTCIKNKYVYELRITPG